MSNQGITEDGTDDVRRDRLAPGAGHVSRGQEWGLQLAGVLAVLAESHLTRRLFGSMLQRIWALPVPTG
jgi:hypothetical protein